ncbi:MAG: protein kinase [Planctomycetota bacterium]
METLPESSDSADPRSGRAAWARLKNVVADALELPAGERGDFLAVATADDAELLRAAQQMLAAADAADSFLLAPALLPPEVAPLAPGTVCGVYVIEERIGEGGFSEVYRARQQMPFERRVALKVLKPGMDSRALLTRFELERRTLARLDHPGIARILDAGATPTGRPFVAMEYVDGKPLSRFVAEQAPPLAVRLDLFLQICAAVTAAHRRGVIHRDLKPGNLLVGTANGLPLAKVIDFGIAKVLEGHGDEATRTGQLLGTPAYCSPEQIAGNGADIDVRSDVWALGIVLGELVAGRRPTPGEPPAGMPRELGWIVAKATAVERENRYAGAAELAADVVAFERGEALSAGPPTRRYRILKFARRHRSAVIAVLFAWLALAVGGAMAVAGYVRAERGRTDAESARREADATADYLARLIGEVLPSRSGRDVKVRDLLDASGPLLAKAAAEPDIAARLHAVVGRAYRALGEFAKAQEHLRLAAASYAERHGELDWRGIEASSDLVGTIVAAGDFVAAEPLIAEVSARANAARGDDHPLARVLIDLRAKLAFDRGRPADAEAPLRELLAIEERGTNTGAVVTVLGNLAQVLLSSKRTAEARALAERGRMLAVETFGPEHAATITATRKRAAVEIQAHDHAAVASLLGPLLPMAERVFGADHPETLGISNYLASALQDSGRLADAEPVYRRLVELQATKLTRLHPQAVMCLYNYARLLHDEGKFSDAEPLLRDSIARFSALRGPDDENALAASYYLCHALAKQGRNAEVAPAFAAAVAALPKRFEPNSRLLLQARSAWCEHLLELGVEEAHAGSGNAARARLEQAFEVATSLNQKDRQRQAATELVAVCTALGDAAAVAHWRALQ